jgi:hypothetical protein
MSIYINTANQLYTTVTNNRGTLGVGTPFSIGTVQNQLVVTEEIIFRKLSQLTSLQQEFSRYTSQELNNIADRGSPQVTQGDAGMPLPISGEPLNDYTKIKESDESTILIYLKLRLRDILFPPQIPLPELVDGQSVKTFFPYSTRDITRQEGENERSAARRYSVSILNGWVDLFQRITRYETGLASRTATSAGGTSGTAGSSGTAGTTGTSGTSGASAGQYLTPFLYRFPTSSLEYIKYSNTKGPVLPLTVRNSGIDIVTLGISSSKDWIKVIDENSTDFGLSTGNVVYLQPNETKELSVLVRYPTSFEDEPSSTTFEDIKFFASIGALTPDQLIRDVTGQENTRYIIKYNNSIFNTVAGSDIASVSSVTTYVRYPRGNSQNSNRPEQTGLEYDEKYSLGSLFSRLNIEDDEVSFNKSVLENQLRALNIILSNFTNTAGAYTTPGNSVVMAAHTWNFPEKEFPKMKSLLQYKSQNGPEYIWQDRFDVSGESKNGGAVRLMKLALANALFCYNGVCEEFPEDYRDYAFSDTHQLDKSFEGTLKYIRAIVQNYINAVQKALQADDVGYSKLQNNSAVSIRQPLTITISTLQVPLLEAMLSAIQKVSTVKELSYFDAAREFKTLVNFGDDKQYVTTAWRRAPRNPNAIQFKLLSPLDNSISIYTPAYISREVAKSVIDKVEFEVAPEADNTPYLRPKNTDVSKFLPQSGKLQNQSLESLGLTTGSAGAILDGKITYEDLTFRRWLSADFNSSELNIDFTNYNNFVQFGSAYSRLAAFYNKLKSVELLSSRIVGNTTGDANIALQKEDIIRNFDPYEQYLYFSTDVSPYSASSAYTEPEDEYNTTATWPKDFNGKPYATTSSIAQTWYYNQSVIAQRYDTNNPNYLYKKTQTLKNFWSLCPW